MAKKFMKKALAMGLALTMCLCLLPMTAFAADSEPESEPIQARAKTCIVCLEWNWEDDGELIPATCTANAKQPQKCSECGNTRLKEKPFSALGHEPGEFLRCAYEVVCGVAHTDIYRCTRCPEEVSKLNCTHPHQLDAANNNIAWEVLDENHTGPCSVCGLPAIVQEHYVETPATCADVARCICGKEMSTEVDPDNHVGTAGAWQVVNGEHVRYYTCCEDVVYDSHGPSFNTYVSNNNATCAKDGTETAECDGHDDCSLTDTRTDVGSKLKQKHTEPNKDGKCGVCGTCLNHRFVERNCVFGGYCANCGALGTERDSAVHPFFDPEHPAEYVKDGMHVFYCRSCEGTVDQHQIGGCDYCKSFAESKPTEPEPDKSHECVWRCYREVMPTCENEGFKDYVCLGCGETRKEADKVPALGHKVGTHHDEIPAACQIDGTRAYDECERCNKLLMDGAVCTAEDLVINAPGEHAWDEGTVTIEPTATEEGERTFTCTREGCGATRTEAIDATGTGDETETEIDETAIPLASGPVSRAEFIDYLWRHEGSPAAENELFADHEYAPAIAWALSAELIDETFQPDELVTVSAARTILTHFASVFGTNAVAADALTTLTGEDGEAVLNCGEVLAEFFGEKYASVKEDDLEMAA